MICKLNSPSGQLSRREHKIWWGGRAGAGTKVGALAQKSLEFKQITTVRYLAHHFTWNRNKKYTNPPNKSRLKWTRMQSILGLDLFSVLVLNKNKECRFASLIKICIVEVLWKFVIFKLWNCKLQNYNLVHHSNLRNSQQYLVRRNSGCRPHKKFS